MKSNNKQLFEINSNNYSVLENYKIGIVVSEWNIDITSDLLKGAQDKLIELGVKSENISTSWVPGSFELV